MDEEKGVFFSLNCKTYRQYHLSNHSFMYYDWAVFSQDQYGEDVTLLSSLLTNY